jgi:hypothetical protein
MEQNLTLSDIVRDPALQVREHLDETWIAELADLYRGLHTIASVEVVFDGERHLLTDGWHRIAAMVIAWGADAVIAVDVIDASGTDDPMTIAKTRAAMANRGAGLRRTEGDKKRAILLLRSTPAGRKMTHDEIAKRIGVDRSHVSKTLSAAENVTSHNNDNFAANGPKPHVAALWAQVDAALRADPGKPNARHATDLDCDIGVVRRRRAALGLDKSDTKRWREDSPRETIVAELARDPGRTNVAIAELTGACKETVGKVRKEMGIQAAPRGPRPKDAPPSAPVNPKRTDDAREQGAEVIPARPPKRADVVTDMMQLFERSDRVDRQAFIAAVYRRWPEYIRNAVEEEREPEVVFQ